MDLMHKNKLNEIDLVAGEEKKFNAISLDTSQYKFDRDEANETVQVFMEHEKNG